MSEEHPSFTANILIADDDPAITRFFAHLLEQGGHRIRTVADGSQALHQILQDCPDILITDWKMPGLAGPDLSRRVRQLHSRRVLPHYTYILLLTTRSGRHLLPEVLDAGVDDFLEKSGDGLANLRAEFLVRLRTGLRGRHWERNLEYASKYDPLTGVLNRGTFFELGRVVWDRSLRHKFPLSAVMIDCDAFRRVNALHGFAAGDLVLRDFAARIRKHSRTTDIACRFDGTKFCILLPGCDESTAVLWAHRIRRTFESTPVRQERFAISVTSTCGIAQRDRTTLTLEELVDRSEETLLLARDTGFNRCLAYRESRPTGDIETTEITEATRIARTDDAEALQTLRDLLDGMTTAEIMLPLTVVLRKDDTLAEAVEFYLRARWSAIPIVDDDDRLVGELRDEDFLKQLGHSKHWSELAGNLARETALVFRADTPLRDVYRLFQRIALPQAYVLDEDGALVGLVDRFQLLRWLRNRWVALAGRATDILPGDDVPDDDAGDAVSTPGGSAFDEFRTRVEGLLDDVGQLRAIVSESDLALRWEDERRDIVSLISRSQDAMDRLLKFSGNETL